MESTTPPPLEDDQWEVCSDGGFIYKRRKRRAADPPPHRQPVPDPAPERKRKALLKLRDQYRKEIDQWEYLSNALLAMEETTRQLRLHGDQATPFVDESLPEPPMDSTCGSIVDDLLLQVEAQEAIIKQASNLCDIAEAMCNTQEEEENEVLINLPVWAVAASPRKLLASLCDP